jgi:predicted KAP-like P-loop ATPase
MEREDGQPQLLEGWESKSISGQDLGLPEHWNDPFVKDWLRLEPPLAGMDLRGVLYVSREHAPFITPEDRLSTEAAALLEALLGEPSMAANLAESLKSLPRSEISILMDKVLAKAQQQQEWGAPDILESALVLAKVDATQGHRLANFLQQRPPVQVKANIIPKIYDQPWAKAVLDEWVNDSEIIGPVKKAINNRRSSQQGVN